MGDWVPYHNYCSSCLKPYPWIGDRLARAKRMIEDESDIQAWDVATKERALELADDLAADRLEPQAISTTARWIEQRAPKEAVGFVWEIVKSLATDSAKNWLRSKGMPV